MHDSVRRSFIAFNAPLEGRIHYMYLDVKGLVTTGVGNLIDSVDAAQRLPWLVGEGGPAASADQVRTEWKMVKSRQDLRNTPADRAFRPITRLRLADASIDALITTRAAADEASLKRIAEFATFDQWPADAQLGLLSMSWAMGSGFAAKGKWPKFRAAVAAGDWTAAALNCDINATGNPGVVPRNTANRQLFNNAQRVVDEGLDAELLLYSVGGKSDGGGQPSTATGQAMFSAGDRCVAYDLTSDAATGGALPLADHWKGLDNAGFSAGVGCVVVIDSVCYAFSGDSYIRLHGQFVDTGYPQGTAENWPGFAEAGFATGPDAALSWDRDKIYFFKGDQYLRYDVPTDQVDDGYPLPIADNWPGLTEAGFATDIDAVIAWPNAKAYFFKGDQYLRYDIATDQADDGYPQSIADNWSGLADAGFASGIDAVWME